MLRLRLAVRADVLEIATLSRDLIETGLGWTWHPARVLASMAARDTNVVVAVEGEELVGFAIMEYGDTRAHLNLLAVRASHQRRGIGRRLLDWQEQAALVAGIQSIELELRASNHSARSFYRRLGFKEAGYVRGYYRGVETALRMRRDIRRPAPERLG